MCSVDLQIFISKFHYYVTLRENNVFSDMALQFSSNY